MSQLSLRYDARWEYERNRERVLEEARRVVGIVGLKQAAFDLDTNPSHLAHALAGRDRHYGKLEWAPYLSDADPTPGFANLMAGTKREAHDRVTLTPEEKLRRIEGALATMSPEIRAAILGMAGLKDGV